MIYLAGHKHYPSTTEKALEYLQNYMESNPNQARGKRSTTDASSKTGAAFVEMKDRECYKCGTKGHISPNCPFDSDDEKVINYRKSKKKGATNVAVQSAIVRTGVQF